MKQGVPKMNRLNQLEKFRRDNVLVDIIYSHKGKENAIGTQELKRVLNEKGFDVRADCIHTVVRAVMVERKIPICSISKQGYYWGASKQDIQLAINSLKDKMNGLQERIEILENFIMED